MYWGTYIIAETLPIMRQIKLIKQKNFATAALDVENEAFVIYVASISQNLDVYSS